MAEVHIGQVWESRDPRDGGKSVTVEKVDSAFVYVRSVRRSRVRRENMSKLYRLVAPLGREGGGQR